MDAAIEAVLFDLDDTLFDQRQWLEGAWRAVAEEGGRHGADPERLHRALSAIAAEGSDKGRIVDRALAEVGASHVPVWDLVRAFRSWRPRALSPWPHVPEALAHLRARVALGLVTDGDPGIQRSKLSALGLDGAFDVVVLADELGRRHRKPNALPFRLALARLGVPPSRAVYVGDRPDKDVAGARGAGMRAVRVRTGEYRGRPDDPVPWATACDVVAAVEILLPLCPS